MPASSVPSSLSDAQVLSAIRLIRDCCGTAYAKDLIAALWGTTFDDSLVGLHEPHLLSELNRWGLDLVLQDTTRNTVRPGMTEYVTNTAYRPIIDALIYDDKRMYRIHPTEINVNRGATTATVHRILSQDVQDLIAVGESTSPQLESARSKYRDAVSQPLVLPVLTAEQIATKTESDHTPGTAVEVNMAGALVNDIDLADIVSRFNTTTVSDCERHGVCIKAPGTVFTGEYAQLSWYDAIPALTVSIDCERAIFDVKHVSFTRSHGSPYGINQQPTLLNFRDSTFTSSVVEVTFAECDFHGFTVTFEDASFQNTHLCFDNARLTSCGIYLYQMVAPAPSVVTFVDSHLMGSTIDFSDSLVGSILFYSVHDVPECDLSFRRCSTLAIENCVLSYPIKIACVEQLSLAGSHMNGLLLYVRNDDRRAGYNPRFWILDALDSEPKRRESLADELAALKEVFHGMGEYSLEDEAFVRYMRYSSGRGPMRVIAPVLDTLGRFGTSPGRIAASLGIVAVIFWVINMMLIAFMPDWAFTTSSTGFLPVEALLLSWAALVQGSAHIQPASSITVGISLFQTTVGWFFLGYFFVAFTRKTLR